MAKYILLSQGKLAIVDDEDYELVSQYKWYARKKGNTFHARENSVKPQQYMHTLITGFKQTDHINGNGLDNRRINLREANHSQNAMNRTKIKTHISTSIYKGVSWKLQANKWCAQIKINGKTTHIGYFRSEIAAAKAYDEAARSHHGEYGTYNFPKDGERSSI